MASIPGSHYDIFAGNQTVNIAVTADPNVVPPPVPGDFNLEVVVNATGAGSGTPAAGYQGLAFLSTDSHTLTALHSNFGIVDGGGSNDLVILGDGSVSIAGASGDTLQGGSGPNQFLDAHLGGQTVILGSGGSETVFGGANTSVSAAAATSMRRSPASRARRSRAAAAASSSLTAPGAACRSAAAPATSRFGAAPETRSAPVPEM